MSRNSLSYRVSLYRHTPYTDIPSPCIKCQMTCHLTNRDGATTLSPKYQAPVIQWHGTISNKNGHKFIHYQMFQGSVKFTSEIIQHAKKCCQLPQSVTFVQSITFFISDVTFFGMLENWIKYNISTDQISWCYTSMFIPTAVWQLLWNTTFVQWEVYWLCW